MKKRVTSKNLRNLIVLEKKIEKQNETGGYDILWGQVDAVYAEIKQLRQYNYRGELFNSMQISNVNYYLITIRYISNLTYNMRIRFRSKIFRIIKINNLNEGDFLLEIIAEEEMKNELQ